MFTEYPSHEETPLHRAARQGLVAKCVSLIHQGADPNALDGYGATPLTDVLLRVELLLRNGISFEDSKRTKHEFEESMARAVQVLMDGGATMEKAIEEYMFVVPEPVYHWLEGVQARADRDQMLASTPPAPKPPAKAFRI